MKLLKYWLKILYNAHKDELEPFQGVVNLTTPSGAQETTIFNEKGES